MRFPSKSLTLATLLAMSGACSSAHEINNHYSINPQAKVDIKRDEAPQRPSVKYFNIQDLSKEDKSRIESANYYLAKEGFHLIPEDSRISEQNLEQFRLIVDFNNDVVDKLEDRWLKEAGMLTTKLRIDLMAKVQAGDTKDLPLRSEENNLTKRHPYEAVTQLNYAGECYILRVHPDEAPILLELGSQRDLAYTRRLTVLNSEALKLFENAK